MQPSSPGLGSLTGSECLSGDRLSLAQQGGIGPWQGKARYSGAGVLGEGAQPWFWGRRYREKFS